jgi:predicted RNA-binding Zn ribbon-like protein
MVTPGSGAVERSEPAYNFDFCGGHVAIDFTNTVGNRGDSPEEHLKTYGDLLAWARARGVMSRGEAAKLARRAAGDPDAAARALGRAIDLREALYTLMSSIVDRSKPEKPQLTRLNDYVAETFGAAHLAVEDGRLILKTPADDRLDAMLVPVVRSAVELLTSDATSRIGRCADEGCAWLFLDTTRSGTRRWCDMKSCGNRNKVRRFRAT